VWIVATLIVLVLCTPWHNATGAWRGLAVDGEPFWQTSWRLEIVFAVILGYVFACGSWIVRNMRPDLDALAPVLAIEPSELAAERAGIAVHSLVNAMLPPGHSALDDRSWRFIRDVTVWTLSIRLMLVVIGSSRRVSQLSERVARIDLLDLRGLAPLARIGLRSALVFALAASMIVVMASDELTIPVTLLTMAIVGAVGAFTVPLPVRGVHRAIRAAKDAELLAVRAAIARRSPGAQRARRTRRAWAASSPSKRGSPAPASGRSTSGRWSGSPCSSRCRSDRGSRAPWWSGWSRACWADGQRVAPGAGPAAMPRVQAAQANRETGMASTRDFRETVWPLLRGIPPIGAAFRPRGVVLEHSADEEDRTRAPVVELPAHPPPARLPAPLPVPRLRPDGTDRVPRRLSGSALPAARCERPAPGSALSPSR